MLYCKNINFFFSSEADVVEIPCARQSVRRSRIAAISS